MICGWITLLFYVFTVPQETTAAPTVVPDASATETAPSPVASATTPTGFLQFI